MFSDHSSHINPHKFDVILKVEENMKSKILYFKHIKEAFMQQMHI